MARQDETSTAACTDDGARREKKEDEPAAAGERSWELVLLVELVLGSREGADAAFFATTVVTRPGVAAGDENDALARGAGFFSPEAPAGDVRSASFSWSASWTAKARSFRTARALSPAWSFQDSPATHRNRRPTHYRPKQSI